MNPSTLVLWLMQAGLRPADANRAVRQAAASPALMQGGVLRDAMRHHKRRARAWFPFDTVLVHTQ